MITFEVGFVAEMNKGTAIVIVYGRYSQVDDQLIF